MFLCPKLFLTVRALFLCILQLFIIDTLLCMSAAIGGGGWDKTGSGHSRVFYAGGTWLRSWGGSRGCAAGGGLLAGRWGVGVRWGHRAHIFLYFICRRGNGPG